LSQISKPNLETKKKKKKKKKEKKKKRKGGETGRSIGTI